jgi:phospholipid/cholesterol/gamma-HCH transport system substrate-binding protein
MRRSNRVKWSELKIAIVVIFAFAFMLYASFTGGGTSIFEGKNFFVIYFDNVKGLTPGSPIWVRGIEVGNVKSIEFAKERNQIKVVGRVTKNVWDMIKTDASVKVSSIGLIGDKYLELDPGDPSLPTLENHGVVKAAEDDSEKIMGEGVSALENMNALSKQLKITLELINEGEGTIGKIFTDDSMYDNLDEALVAMKETMDGLNRNQDRAFASLEDGVASMRKLADALTDSSGTVGRLLYDSTLYTNMSSMTERFGSILAKIDSGQGTIGGFVNDDSVYENLHNLMARLENLLLDMEMNPKKYFKVSVF